MPHNPNKTKRFSIDMPLDMFKKLKALAKKLDRSVSKTAYGLIWTSLVSDKEYDRMGKK